MYVDLDTAKKHLNIEPDFVEDDEYITLLIEAAEAAVSVNIDESLDELADGGCLPAPLYQAILLAVGNWYQNREIVGQRTTQLPINYTYLCNLYRTFKKI